MASAGDWARVAAGILRHPRGGLNALRVRRRHPDWWRILDGATAARFAEAGTRIT
jgi:hypothetical protein